MLDSKDVPVPLTEKIDELIQNPAVMFGAMGVLFAIVVAACTISHLGSDTRGRPH